MLYVVMENDHFRFRCKNLSILILRINNLHEIPDVHGELPELKYVDVSCNKLTKIPASFAKLTTLEVLNVANNQVYYLLCVV